MFHVLSFTHTVQWNELCKTTINMVHKYSIFISLYTCIEMYFLNWLWICFHWISLFFWCTPEELTKGGECLIFLNLCFLTMATLYIIVWIYSNLFNESSFNGHLSCFQFFKIVKNNAVNIHIHIHMSLWLIWLFHWNKEA